MCHVFRCELPARHIANTLCEICKKVIAQRTAASSGTGQRSRPSDLPNLHPVGSGTGNNTITFENLLKSECSCEWLLITFMSLQAYQQLCHVLSYEYNKVLDLMLFFIYCCR